MAQDNLATQTATPPAPTEFKLGDGNTYDIKGSLIKPAPAADFNVKVPDTFSSDVTGAAFASGAPTVSDIRDKIATKQSAIDTNLQKVMDYFTPTPEEKVAADTVAKLKGEAAQIQQDTQNQVDTENIGMKSDAVTTAQQAETQRQGLSKLNSKNIELQTAIDTLGNLQASRGSKLQAAQFLYDASKNDLSDTINIYKTLAPENIGTQVDQATGDVYVITKNPLTSQVSVQKAGNVGASKAYQSTQIKVDENTGDTLFYGVKPDGSVETKVLSKGTGPTNITYETREVGGRQVRFGFDKTGKVVSKVDLGASNSANTGAANGIKFAQTDIQQLAGAGLSQTQIKALESDINNYGLDKVINGNSGLSDDQKNMVKAVLGGATYAQQQAAAKANNQFLSTDYFKNLFGNDQLEKSASEAGYKAGGFLGIGKHGDVDAYLKHLMDMVGQYRQAGYTDQEILKMMQ